MVAGESKNGIFGWQVSRLWGHDIVVRGQFWIPRLVRVSPVCHYRVIGSWSNVNVQTRVCWTGSTIHIRISNQSLVLNNSSWSESAINSTYHLEIYCTYIGRNGLSCSYWRQTLLLQSIVYQEHCKSHSSDLHQYFTEGPQIHSIHTSCMATHPCVLIYSFIQTWCLLTLTLGTSSTLQWW